MSPSRWEMPPVFLQSGDPNTENVASLLYKGQLGMRFTVIEPPRGGAQAVQFRSKTYQLVQTDSSMAVAPYPGAVAWWSDKTKYLATTSASKLGRGRIAGVFNNAITPGNYGCIQTEGPCTVKFIDSPTATPSAAGLFVIPSSTDGKADCLAAGSSPTYPPLGVSSGAMSLADNTGPVDLDVPQTT